MTSLDTKPPVVESTPDFNPYFKPVSSLLKRLTKTPVWALVVAMTLFCISICFLCHSVLRATKGTFTYVLDDPYISASMAKNLVQHHVLGVTRYGFSSSSSSIIWPFLLAGVDVMLGVHVLNPFVLNLFLASILVILCYAILRRLQPSAGPAYLLVSLLLIILLMPLDGLVFVGLEHILHAIATIAFAYVASVSLSAESGLDVHARTYAALVGLAALVTLSRYEGAFIVAIVAGLLLCKARWKAALAVAGSSLVPIVAFGVFSKSTGAFFLPNSLLLKGGTLRDALVKLRGFPYSSRLMIPSDLQTIAGFACILFLAKFATSRTVWERKQLMLITFVFTTVIHLQIAAVGWFYRYEGYLIAWGVLGIACSLYDSVWQIITEHKWPTVCTLMLCLCILRGESLLPRSVGALRSIPLAAKNIYEQQYQMSRFVGMYYNGSVVSVNDIGAINYFADIHCLDLYGLGSVDVTRLKRESKFDSRTMDEYVRSNGGKIAIIYDDWYKPYGGVPATWVKVGAWRFRDVVVEGGDVVSFYAMNPDQAEILMRNLRDFSDTLPPVVRQSGRYIDQ